MSWRTSGSSARPGAASVVSTLGGLASGVIDAAPGAADAISWRLGEAGAPLKPRIDSEIARHLGWIDSELTGRDWLVGEGLTGADIQLSFVADIARVFGLRSRYPALDACVALGCAYNSVICRVGEEANDASHASVGTVAGFIEMLEERDLTDEELYEHEYMEAELEFQVELLKRVAHERDSDRILAIRTFAAQDGVSNIGISLEE